MRLPWPLTGAGQHSPWRLLASIAAITLGIAHIPLIQEHLAEAPYIGTAFLGLAVAGLILGQLLLTTDTTSVWIAATLLAAADLIGYLLSRTIGLPQIHDDIGHWGEPLGIVCMTAEAVLLAAACLHFLRSTHPEA